jgi:hypothetical protein
MERDCIRLQGLDKTIVFSEESLHVIDCCLSDRNKASSLLLEQSKEIHPEGTYKFFS